jgi:transposase
MLSFHSSKNLKMAQKNRRRFDGNFKTKVVIEALKERKTMSALAKEFSLHPQQITDWKKQAVDALPELFRKDSPVPPPDIENITAPLYQKNRSVGSGVGFFAACPKKISAH